MNDRKYGHKGYMESDRGEGGRRPSGPRPPRPEGPRGRGADQDKAVVFVCRACGEKLRDLGNIRADSPYARCGGELHACRQCASFAHDAHMLGRESRPSIADKNSRNTCSFYEPAKSFDLAGSKSVNTPRRRAAFARLFKK
jgi:hypothetical protein